MVYVIAEIGCNHNGDVNLAKEMVDAAVHAGVDAVKFQTFKADKLISKFAPKADYQKITTGTQDSQLEMTKRLELSYDDYLVMKDYCEKAGVEVFSTAFDEDSLEFLIGTGMRTFKISSGEITNLPFLEKIGAQDGHVILSTGMATMSEIHTAVDVLTKNGSHDITILHCTTDYPTKYQDINLNVMKSLKAEFPDYAIGFSDHSIGYQVPIMAAALGATVIEKHFTTDNNLPGPDQKASGTPDIFEKMVKGIRIAEVALGSAEKHPVAVELANRVVARKSIIAKTSIQKGEVFTTDNITLKRPGNGISPMDWYKVLGKESQRDFSEDELIIDNRFEIQGEA